MISVKSDKIISSWNKIAPSDSADERMLSAILDQNRSARERKGAEIAKQTGHRMRHPKWGLIGACLALIMVVGSVTFAVAAEAEEYNNAVAFFEENGLSAEGLSRSEVKAVYRDITQKKFSYEKTAEVIRQAVPGWDIQQHEPIPEELAALWDKTVRMNAVSPAGISYRIDVRYIMDENRGFEVLEKSLLECCRDGEMLWTAEFTDFYLEGYTDTENGIMVWGLNEVFGSGDTSCGWISFVDHSGRIVWQRKMDHGFAYEYVAAILNNGDGTWAVFSRGDGKYLCLSSYSEDGTELDFHQTEVGNLGIWNAARLGDGYIVQLGNTTSHKTALLYKMDREGQITDSFSYEADDCEYYITDLTEYRGQVYLSAYAVPMQNDGGGRHEIANVLDYISSEKKWDITSEELTPLVRENYTAVLLICDPGSGTPKTFYSVKGSLGGALSVNGSGQLEWNVESITAAFFSPATSSFTIGGNCSVFCYTFNAEGSLIGQKDAGDTVPYRR